MHAHKKEGRHPSYKQAINGLGHAPRVIDFLSSAYTVINYSKHVETSFIIHLCELSNKRDY